MIQTIDLNTFRYKNFKLINKNGLKLIRWPGKKKNRYICLAYLVSHGSAAVVNFLLTKKIESILETAKQLEGELDNLMTTQINVENVKKEIQKFLADKILKREDKSFSEKKRKTFSVASRNSARFCSCSASSVQWEKKCRRRRIEPTEENVRPSVRLHTLGLSGKISI